MSVHFSGGAIYGMIFTIALSLLVPFILLVYYRFKKNANFSRFFVGILMYMAYELFRPMVYVALLYIPAFKENAFLLPIFYSLGSAALWVVINYMVIKYVFKNNNTPNNSLMLATGFSGFGSFVGASVTVTTLLNAIMVNNYGITKYMEKIKSATIDPEVQRKAIADLSQIHAMDYASDGIIRILTIATSLALTLIIYHVVMKPELKKFLGICIGLYFILLLPGTMIDWQKNLKITPYIPIGVAILICLVITFCSISFAKKIHRTLTLNPKMEN